MTTTLPSERALLSRHVTKRRARALPRLSKRVHLCALVFVQPAHPALGHSVGATAQKPPQASTPACPMLREYAAEIACRRIRAEGVRRSHISLYRRRSVGKGG